MPETFGEKVIRFNDSLEFSGLLPPGIEVMNPFRENACANLASRAFYRKYYNDENLRGIILGINPGRFGAGITGVPFTDPVRLKDRCHIEIPECPNAREPSSEFIYQVISLYGGEKKFYSRWYVNSICPLGFTMATGAGRVVNYNYYDSKALEMAAAPFILKTLPEQIALGINPAVCFCLGAGKNFSFMERLNREHKFFGKIIPLDHPRYIMQYKSRQRKEYAEKYASLLMDWENTIC